MRARTVQSALALALGLVSSYVLLAPLAAQPSSGPLLYVGTQDGSIFRVDGATGETTLLHQFQEFALTEDVELCADGRLYVSGFDKIARLKTDGTDAEIIFNQADHPSESELANYYPEGFACDSVGNLMTNERGPDASGLWLLPNITKVPFNGPFPSPVRMTEAYTEWGEDAVILDDGSIAAVANTESRVDRFTPRFGDRTTLIPVTGLSPSGLGQNDAGEFFVSDINQVLRYDASGNLIEVFSTFPEGEEPLFLELDLNGTLYVAGASGLWRLDNSGSQALVASIPGANGVAIDWSTAPVTKTLAFSPSQTSAAIAFGNGTFKVDFLGSVKNAFELSVERRLVPPSALQQDLDPNSTALALPGDNGFVTVLQVQPPPAGRGNFRGKVRFTWAFNFTEQIEHPQLFRRTNDDPFPTDELTQFSLIGTDRKQLVGAMDTEGFGQFVLATESFAPQHFPCDVDVLQNGSTTLRAGSPVRFRFRLKTEPDCTGGFRPSADVRLSVVRLTDTGEAELLALPKNEFEYNNNNNRYAYVLNTTNYTPGDYCATIHFHYRPAGALPFLKCFALESP